MPRSFDSLLEQHARHIPREWRPFAKLVPSPYNNEDSAWGSIAYGFRVAAETLARDCYEKYPNRRILYSPIFYVYRHYLELQLKYACRHYDILENEKTKPSHDILELWHKVLTFAIDSGIASAHDQFLTSISHSIKLIHDVDERSTHSRYPQNIKGDTHDIDLDLEKFITSMDDIDTFFFALSAKLNQ